MKRRAIVLGLSTVLGACTGTLSQQEPFPREWVGLSSDLTSSDAVALAKAAAERRGIDLSAYEAPDVSRSSGSWTVFFEGRGGALGDHFCVAVDASSRTTFFSPGR